VLDDELGFGNLAERDQREGPVLLDRTHVGGGRRRRPQAGQHGQRLTVVGGGVQIAGRRDGILRGGSRPEGRGEQQENDGHTQHGDLLREIGEGAPRGADLDDDRHTAFAVFGMTEGDLVDAHRQ
jgi:hypothetical protein